jgi:acyl transferase domain-containing protein/3-hydroxymyristoyl/3-hydroxydecanoyl-(acyl carrier protein) dehydratase/1-acyl-sn-glycerol-3-phosphate acyltransferase
MTTFPPIAVVGYSCVLPSAFSPAELWSRVISGEDLLSHAPAGYWRANPEPLLSREKGRPIIATDRGGYVEGFEKFFDPHGFALPADELLALDPLFQWVLWGARTALDQARHDYSQNAVRAGLIIGNLGYPSSEATRYAEAIWTGAPHRPSPANRFHFGLPSVLTAQALRLGLGGMSLDAACASSLYAIKLACDKLHDGDADIMVAGGVNRSDSLFLHAGFTALGALSPTGQSLPFHSAADGLIPSEGGAFVALKRLDDAIAHGDKIACLIRGVGLSNDGRTGGLLTPSMDGQVRAMKAAYAMAGLRPEQISYVECHATGTPVGDDTEIRSMDEVFSGLPELAVGSLKSNLGHLMTAAGAAGLIKVIEALKAEILPGMRNADEPSAAMKASRFRIFGEAKPWTAAEPRYAAINAFGFGGNNAHLILEQWTGTTACSSCSAIPVTPLAIIGLGVSAGDGQGKEDFLRTLAGGQSRLVSAERIELSPTAVRFPPKDLQDCDGLQLIILKTAIEAVADAKSFSAERTGVFIGMEASAETARHCAAWRISDVLSEAGHLPASEWLEQLYEVLPPLARAATVVGTMPNMPANRLNSQYNFRGPGFTIAASARSGEVALRTAMRALRAGEIDTAVVGSVGLCREPVHESAIAASSGRISGDGAVVLVLKRSDDVEDGNVYALIDEGSVRTSSQVFDGVSATLFGDSYAATGLLDVAAAALFCRYRLRWHRESKPASYWIAKEGIRAVSADSIPLMATTPLPFFFAPPSVIYRYYGADRNEVIAALRLRRQSLSGTARLAIVAAHDKELEERCVLAEQLLSRGLPARNATLAEGIYYSDSPIGGELAFVFTGAGAAYPGMGKELLLSFPDLAEDPVWRKHLELRAAWIYGETEPAHIATSQYLHGASFLCQVHAQLTLEVLKLRPAAALGLSSGESNALFAFGAWQDPDAMFEAIEQSGLYERELSGSFDAVRNAWRLTSGESLDWVTWRISTPVQKLRVALESEPRVKLLIIHHEGDSLIGGDAAACARLLKILGNPPAQQSAHNLAVHCAEVASFGDRWWKIHCRTVSPVPGIRFYTNATGDSYVPSDRLTADMLLKQAMETIDFPRTVLKAWEDGVRVFVEHGPRSLCSEWIQRILGDRPHTAVPLDRFGKSSFLQAVHAAAQLSAIGADIDIPDLFVQRMPVDEQRGNMLTFPAHPPRVVIPAFVPARQTMQAMPAAPFLPEADPEPKANVRAVAEKNAFVPVDSRLLVDPAVSAVKASGQALREALKQHVRILQLTLDAHLRYAPDPSVQTPLPQFQPQTELPRYSAFTSEPSAPGPKFNREQLLIHANGKISSIFGDLFRQQDQYRRQVRMPGEPMLLADRVTGISGEPGSMGIGTIWTETDITETSWYLHERRIPAGLLIEAGQADLMLVSWLGADLSNRDERIYRLLGCDLTWHGQLPQIGDTLHYEIHIDGYTRQGPVLLFFFHYDCRTNDGPCLTVRNGQAGFFTDEELAQSSGVLWDANAAHCRQNSAILAPVIEPRAAFSQQQIQLFAQGRSWECFGEGYEYAGPHKLSPRIPGGKLLLLDEVTHLDPRGGPWKRGYMRAEKAVASSDWFFEGHFKNDPCMPGTLMAEACQQALGFYLAALGFTLERDGWRFEPVTEEQCSLRCRAQVTPSARRLVYEVFIEELTADPLPTVFADILVSVDGVKALHAKRMGVRMVPDWPLEGRLQVAEADRLDLRPAAGLGGFRYDRESTLQSALGRPSKAFGPHFKNYDGPLRMARLPAPPFNFVSRLSRVQEPPDGRRNGILIETEYDLRETDWFLQENGAPVMPLSVLMEVTIQPCGWSSVYGIQDDPHERDRFFRNLDGTATLLAPIGGTGLLRSVIRMRSISRSSGIILTSFDVEAWLDEKLVYTLKTGCGFFLKEGLAMQAGLPATDDERRQYEQLSGFHLELDLRPERYFRRSARLPDSKLLMLDRITGLWPGAGSAGIARVRSQKDIRPDEWFLKAHFFQDPVQPGSLGIEAMNQTLHFYMLHSGLDGDLLNPQFEAFAIGETHTWRYRGQVLPSSRKMDIELDIIEVRRESDAILVRANGWLWVDGARIYEAKNIAARLRSGVTATRQTAGASPIIDRNLPGETLLIPHPEILQDWWKSQAPGQTNELANSLVTAYCCKFVRRVAAVSPGNIQALHGKPVLFVANHQTICESMLFPLIMPLITGSQVVTLAKKRVKGDVLVQAFFQLLKGRLDEPILYIDQDDPQSIIKIMERFRQLMTEQGKSVLIHSQGVRTLSCRERLTTVSAIVSELAISAGVPIVPVRLYGGLPIEPLDYKIDFPVGYGSQDYVLGYPITPDDLARMDLKDRKQAILDGINGIVPLPEIEAPNPADSPFQAGVADRIRVHGMGEAEAVLLQCVEAPDNIRLADWFPQE